MWRDLQEWASRVFGVDALGPEQTNPAAARNSVEQSVAEHETHYALKAWEAIDRCADAAADAILSTSPGLDREHLRMAVARELWDCVSEITTFARAGVELW